jgi:transcriptional regulator with PAS, ATPase and Fis domain
MTAVLLTWVGATDLKASRGDPAAGAGPVAQAVTTRTFDHVVLLNDYSEGQGVAYAAWLRPQTSATVTVRKQTLTTPTHYGDIYRAAASAAAEVVQEHGKKAKLTFHLSPGTPAMTAIWILVAKTQIEAELIESSRDHGVTTVDVPFEIAAELIPSALRRADQDLERLALGFRPEEPAFAHILHQSDAMKRLLARAQQAAPYSVPILIQGETGTGKELLAAAIHHASPRAKGRFIAVNCGAVPANLVESEFFGHRKGAFTGADSEHKGHFEEAAGGTLFLDEVGELSAEAQVKLLRAVQEKKITRVGTSKSIDVDVRVIAATHRNLLGDVERGTFREDLFFRLAVLVLHTPPLREREGDITLLARKLLEKLNDDAAQVPGHVHKKLSAGATKCLLRHDWPGNVRELESTLLRAMVWSKGSVIEADDVREALVSAPGRSRVDLLEQPLGDGFDLRAFRATVTEHYLKRALEEAGGNKTKAAKLVGLPNYQTFTNWLNADKAKE